MKKLILLLTVFGLVGACFSYIPTFLTNYPAITSIVTQAGVTTEVYELDNKMPMSLWTDIINYNTSQFGGTNGSILKVDVDDGVANDLAAKDLLVDGMSVSNTFVATGGLGVTGGLTNDALVVTSSITVPDQSISTLAPALREKLSSTVALNSITNNGQYVITGGGVITNGPPGTTPSDEHWFLDVKGYDSDDISQTMVEFDGIATWSRTTTNSGASWTTPWDPAIVDDSVTFSKMNTITNYSVIGNVSGVTTNPTEVMIIDDDTMSTAESNNLVSAESIKSYVDYHGIIQMVHTNYSNVSINDSVMAWDDSIPQITEGEEVMTCSITPMSPTSTLKVDVLAGIGGGLGDNLTVALFSGSVSNAVISQPAEYELTYHTMTYIAQTGTTNEITFSVRAGGATSGDDVMFNGGSPDCGTFGGTLSSSITITEIK